MKESEALWAIAHHEPATNAEIATALDTTPENARPVTRRLFVKGFLEREQHKHDGPGVDLCEYTLSEDYER